MHTSQEFVFPVMSPQSSQYDLFISYATDPDYGLSRKVELFLESFHTTKVDSEFELRPLKVCRDGSSFTLRDIEVARRGASTSEYTSTEMVLAEYLAQCENLLVLCSEAATRSDYIAFEISWFLKNKPDGIVFIAITEGESLGTIEFPKPVFESSLPHEFALDFRGSKKESQHWEKVKDYDEQMVSLAAQLNGYSSSKLLPSWRTEQQRQQQALRRTTLKRRTISAIALVAIVVLAAGSYRFSQVAQKEEAKLDSNQFAREADVALFEKHDIALATDNAERALNLVPHNKDAKNILKLVHSSQTIDTGNFQLQNPDIVPLKGTFKFVSEHSGYILTYSSKDDATYIWNDDSSSFVGEVPGEFFSFNSDQQFFYTRGPGAVLRRSNLAGNSEVIKPSAVPAISTVYGFLHDIPVELPEIADNVRRTIEAGSSSYDSDIDAYRLRDGITLAIYTYERGGGYMATEPVLVSREKGMLSLGIPGELDRFADSEAYEFLGGTENYVLFAYEDEYVYVDLVGFRAYHYTGLHPDHLELLPHRVFESNTANYIEFAESFGYTGRYYFDPRVMPGRLVAAFKIDDILSLVSTDSDNTYVWKDKRRHMSRYFGTVVAAHPSLPFLMTEPSDGIFALWDRRKRLAKPVKEFSGQLARLPSARPYVLLKGDQEFTVVDLLEGSSRKYPFTLELASFDLRYAFGARGAELFRVDLDNNEEQLLPGFEMPSPDGELLASPDGELLVVKEGGGRAVLLNVDDLEVKSQMPQIYDGDDDIILSYGNEKAAILTGDKRLFQWNITQDTLQEIDVEPHTCINEYDGPIDCLSLRLVNFSAHGDSFFAVRGESEFVNDDGENDYAKTWEYLVEYNSGSEFNRSDLGTTTTYVYSDIDDEPDADTRDSLPAGCNCFYDAFLSEYHSVPATNEYSRFHVISPYYESGSESGGDIAKKFNLQLPYSNVEISKVYFEKSMVCAITSRGNTVVWDLKKLESMDAQ